MLGMPQEELRPIAQAVLSRKVSGVPEKKTYVRVCVALMDGKVVAVPISAKGSGSISTMTQSNGYVILDEDCEGIAEGETVTVHMFASLEVA
jgi:molybdopterin molybdotransferase